MPGSSTRYLIVLLGICVARLLSGRAIGADAVGTVTRTTPASVDDSERTRALFRELLQQGTNALAAEEYPAAIERLLDARELFDRRLRGKTVTVGGPEHVALLHGLALAYQLTQKPERASPLFENNSPLDRACSSKNVSRQLLVTRATLGATQGYLAMRTVVGLTNYLKEHPDELDSELLDLLFTALQKADTRVSNRELTLEPSIKLYEEFNSRLEATRPGEKRWGVQWVSKSTFDTQMKKRQAAIKAYDAAAAKLDDARAAVKDAERNLEASRRNGYYTKARFQAASDKLARARNVAYDKQKLAEEARAAIPAVPSLTADDFRRILTPHNVDVVVAKSGTTPTASTAGTSREIQFSLGGLAGDGRPKAVTSTAATGHPTTPATPYEPPPAAPPSKRAFSRSATGFAVGPDLILTTASAVNDAKRVIIEMPGGQPIEAAIERTGDEGLALLRVRGGRFSYLNLASEFDGGNVSCPAFPDVSVFGVEVESIPGKALKPQEKGWRVALNKHPRLPGAPLLDGGGRLVGIEVAERDDLKDRVPALPPARIKSFLAENLPAQPCATSREAAVVQITASFER